MSYTTVQDVLAATRAADQRSLDVHRNIYRGSSSEESSCSSGNRRKRKERVQPYQREMSNKNLSKDQRLQHTLNIIFAQRTFVFITDSGEWADHSIASLCEGKLHEFVGQERRFPEPCVNNLYEVVYQEICDLSSLDDIATFVDRSYKSVVRIMCKRKVFMLKRDNNYIKFRNLLLDRRQRRFRALAEMPAGLVPYKTIDTNVDCVTDLSDLRIPKLMQLMQTQKWNESVIVIFLAMLGRVWRGTHREAADTWHVLPFAIGEAGTGKSTVLDLLRLGFPDELICEVNNSSQDSFRAAGLLHRQVVLVDELHSKQAGFQNDFWWKLATGTQTMPVRNIYERQTEMKLNHGTFLAGLKVMKMESHGDFKSFNRRALSFPFTEKPSVVDGDLLYDIVQTGEIGHIMLAAEFMYQSLLGSHDNIPVPRMMVQAASQDQGHIDVVASVINHCVIETGDPRDRINIVDLNKMYNKFCKVNSLKKPSTYIWGFSQADKMKLHGDTTFTKMLSIFRPKCSYNIDDENKKQRREKRKWFIYGAKLHDSLKNATLETAEDDTLIDSEVASSEVNPLYEDFGAFVHALNEESPLPLHQALETDLCLASSQEDIAEALGNKL